MKFIFFLMMIAGFSGFAASDSWRDAGIFEKERVKSLEEKYRARMLPPSKEEAFFAGYDVPAQMIDESSYNFLLASWKPFLEKLNQTKIEKNTNDRTLGRDWLQIAEFNYEAAKIWEELKVCAGGDSERAREFYYKIVSQCSNGSIEEAKVIFSKISSYKMQVLNFLQTSEIRDPRARIEYGENRAGDRVQEIIKMPATHPLFIQVVLEATAMLYRHPRLDKKSYDTHGIKMAMNFLQGKSDEITLEMYAFKSMPSKDFEYVRFLMNTKLIIDSLKNEKCEEWGLWPGISQAVAFFTYSSYTQLIFDHKNELSERMRDACGSELHSGSIIFWHTNPRTEVKKNFLYVNEHIFFAKEFRSLIDRYYQLSIENTAKSEGKTCIFGVCF